MISFDSLTLKAWIKENSDFLTGARIQKIQQPDRREFVFVLRKSGEIRKLYININPKMHHICFMDKENEERRMIDIPKKPPMFCMLLRKYLENAVICRVIQPPYERILEFYIETYNELSEKIYLCFAIEFMGKHSNAVLYNSDTNVIIGCAHNIGSEKSSVREMAGTLPYVYPPRQNKIDIMSFNGTIDFNLMNFYWISKPFAKRLKGIPLSKIKDFVSLKEVAPAVSKDFGEFSLFAELLPECVRFESVNSMIDYYFSYHQEKEKFESLKAYLTAFANRKINRTKSSLDKINEQLIREQGADKYRLYGDLLMANLYNCKDFSASAEVYDYENKANIVIVLDNSKTVKENANKFYKLYRKSKTSLCKLQEMKESLKGNLNYFAQLLYSVNTAENIKDLSEIKNEIEPSEVYRNEKRKSIEPKRIEINGFVIYIGKNNRENDYIISKLAKDDDLWFHIKDNAGSHVLLKGVNPPDEIILKCAKLAKEYSSAADSLKAGVIYTRSKYLRKPPKANLGYVTYRNEKEILTD